MLLRVQARARGALPVPLGPEKGHGAPDLTVSVAEEIPCNIVFLVSKLVPQLIEMPVLLDLLEDLLPIECRCSLCMRDSRPVKEALNPLYLLHGNQHRLLVRSAIVHGVTRFFSNPAT